MFLLIFGITCSLRLIGLGGASLTLNEAENALGALEMYTNSGGGHILYALPTALLFRFFGDSDFTARLIPALSGILLSLIPLFLHKRIGYRKALLLSLLFGVDPVLLFWSKRADALIPAMALAAAGTACILCGKKISAAAFLLLSLGGGERSLPALILCILFGVLYIHFRASDLQETVRIPFTMRSTGIASAVLLLCITAFGTFPEGISLFCSGIFNSFRPAPDWAYPGISGILIAVLIYSGVPLLLFIVSCCRNNHLTKLITVLIASVILTVWQGIFALPWISAFLWIACTDILLQIPAGLRGQKGFPFFISSCTVVGAYSFLYFRLVEVFNQQNGTQPAMIVWNGSTQTLPFSRTTGAALLTLLSVLILALVLKILLGYSDSPSIRAGMLFGALVIFGWAMITNIWNTGGYDRIGDHPAAPHPQNSLLLLNGNYTSFTDTPLMEHLTETIQKHGDSSNTVYGLNLLPDDLLLKWQLRKEKGIRTTANGREDLNGIELILADPGISYEAQGFVGTNLTYRNTMHWEQLSLIDWGKWVLFGDGLSSDKGFLTMWVIGNFIYAGDEAAAGK